jgi:hypothetical protein
VTLYGKRNFAEIMKLRILRWRDYPGLYGWAQYNHRIMMEAVDSEPMKDLRMEEEPGTGCSCL